MNGRKKSVSRKKSGGRQKPAAATSTRRAPIGQRKQKRRDAKPIKIPKPTSDYMTTIDAITRRVKRKWWVLEKGWDKDPGLRQLAKSDAEDILGWIRTQGFYQLTAVEKTHGSGASYARDAVEIRLAQEFLISRDPKWGPERMAWVAAELENRNFHPVANYIRLVEIGEIPYDEYLTFRRKHVHKNEGE